MPRLWQVDYDDSVLSFTNADDETFILEPTPDGWYRPLDFPYGEARFRFERIVPGGTWQMIVERNVGNAKFTKLEVPSLSAGAPSRIRG